MNAQMIARFEDPQKIIRDITKALLFKGISIKDFEVKSTENGGVYVESHNELALAYAYDIRCQIEKLGAQS